MLKALLVDDNYDYLESLFNDLGDNLNNKIKIVKICNDGEKALKYITNQKLDIILLDLNILKINGIGILEKIKENNIKTEVIVITGETKSLIEVINKNLPVRKILLKPFKIANLIEILNEIIDEQLGNPKENIEKIISILDNFNINKSTLGFKYILDCLKICIEQNYTFIPQMKILYKQISDKKISESVINWNISKTIQSMNKLTDRSILEKFFPYNVSPSPKIFLNEILAIYYSLE